MNIIDPAASSTATSVYGLSSFLNVNDQILIGQTHGFYTSAEAHTAIKFLPHLEILRLEFLNYIGGQMHNG